MTTGEQNCEGERSEFDVTASGDVKTLHECSPIYVILVRAYLRVSVLRTAATYAPWTRKHVIRCTPLSRLRRRKLLNSEELSPRNFTVMDQDFGEVSESVQVRASPQIKLR